MKVKTIVEMDDIELDEIVSKKFQWASKWEFVADQEANNGSSYQFVVDGDYDKQVILDILGGSRPVIGWNAQTFLNFLAAFNDIPKGEYLIKVSW